MRKSVLLTTAVAALAVLIVAAGASAVSVRVGGVEVSGDGVFKPSTLSKNELMPISLTLFGGVKRLVDEEGKPPPAVRELIFETDKNGTVDVVGYPTCKAGQLVAQTSVKARGICGKALIGQGKTEVGIDYVEQDEVSVKSDLLMFNGGVKGGVTTLFVHAYITVPAPAAIVTTVKIKRIHKGRYGLLSVASVPKIAGGSGWVKAFNLTIDRKYTYKGKKHSVLNLKCPDGKVLVRVEAIFEDKNRAQLEFAKPCTPKG